MPSAYRSLDQTMMKFLSTIPNPPQPIYSKAIRTIKREDDVKLSESLKEIIETDTSYSIERNAVTQQ